ncbi:MAG: hypothetical protein P8X69_15060, partial [Maritimibacter sp.]
MNETLFGERAVRAEAGDVSHLKLMDMLDRPTGRWVHILLYAQELIRVNNVWLERLVPDMWSIAVGYPDLA